MKLKVETDAYEVPKHGLRVLLACIIAFFLVYCMRFWYLQVHRGEEFAKLSLENRMRYTNTYAARGEIYDINGLVLAENKIAFAITMVREDVVDITASIAQVSSWTNLPFENILKNFQNGRKLTKIFEPIILAQDLPFEIIAPIQTELQKWPGLEVIARPTRNYPQKDITAHVMGYVAEANQDEIREDEDLDLGDIVGRQGIELILEENLRGVKALKSMEVDSRGRILNSKILEEAKSGNNISLNLDVELQKDIVATMGDYSGSVVVINPDNGAVRAFVTKPSYDNNLFITGFSTAKWNELRDNPRYPLQNRTIQSAYPPGSVWKLMMAGFFLENGVDPNEEVFCNGEHKVGNRVFRCWKRGGHGFVNLEEAIVSSCDVYFFAMSEKFNIDDMEEFAIANGFGKPTGIDLPHETSGLVPSRDWKERRFKQKWQTGDTINMSIGQGFTLTTPVQLAVFISSLINGGSLIKPQLISNQQTEIKNFIPIREEFRDLIKNHMVMTVESTQGATAKILKRPDVVIGAKTGTAQVVKIRMVGNKRVKNEDLSFYERDHAWIGAFGEKNGERYVVITMLEHGGGGASAAGPVTKAVFELLFPLPPVDNPIDNDLAKNKLVNNSPIGSNLIENNPTEEIIP